MLSKSDKNSIIEKLGDCFSRFSSFYIVDPIGLTSNEVNQIRRECFKHGIVYRIAKNTLAFKALQSSDIGVDFKLLKSILKNTSGIFFLNEDKLSFPAKLISSKLRIGKDFKMKLKFAFIEGEVYEGEHHLNNLSKLVSKNEMLGSIIGSLKNKLSMVVYSLKKGEDVG